MKYLYTIFRQFPRKLRLVWKWSNLREDIISLLVLFWHFIGWFWASIVAIVLGIIGNFLYCDFTTSKMDLTDPHTWVTTRFSVAYLPWVISILIAATLLTLCSLWANNKRNREIRNGEMNEYILKRVLIIRVMEKQFVEFPEPDQHRGLQGSPTNGESALVRA